MAETEKPANPNSQNPPHSAAPATVTPPQTAPVPDPRVLPEGQTAPAGAAFSNPSTAAPYADPNKAVKRFRLKSTETKSIRVAGMNVNPGDETYLTQSQGHAFRDKFEPVDEAGYATVTSDAWDAIAKANENRANTGASGAPPAVRAHEGKTEKNKK